MIVDGVPQADCVAESKSLFRTIEDVGVSLIEVAAALLLTIEMAVLFAGVVARYIFHRPLVWTDELNSILFLWLGVLGAVLALHRWQHMRMTTFVTMLPAKAQTWISGFGNAVIVVFLVLLLEPAIEHVQTEAGVISPTLEISGFWRAAAMPVGVVLLLIVALLRFRAWPLRNTIVSLVAVAAVAGALLLAQPVLSTLDQANLAIFFLVGVPVMVFAGIPIAFGFSAATFAYLAVGTYEPPSILVARLDSGMSQLLLLAIPTFVFLGLLIEMTGMATRMIGFLSNLLGHVRGGLHYVLVVSMYLGPVDKRDSQIGV